MSKISKLLVVSQEDKKNARKLYEKNEEDIKQDVEVLREWLGKQKHLPQDLDDDWIETFLLRNKFNKEKTKAKLDNYYTLRGIYKDFFQNDPYSDNIQVKGKYGTWLPLPKLTPKNERVIVSKVLNADPKLYNVIDSFNLIFMTMDLCLRNDYASGDLLFVDFEGFTLAHTWKVDPRVFLKFVKLQQEAYSGRFMGAHIINASNSAEAILGLLRNAVSPKFFNKVMMHKSIEDVYEYIPKEILPKEYGGQEKTVAEMQDDWLEELKAQSDWIRKNSKKISDESKRVGEPYHSELFGMQGTFKNLNID